MRFTKLRIGELNTLMYFITLVLIVCCEVVRTCAVCFTEGKKVVTIETNFKAGTIEKSSYFTTAPSVAERKQHGSLIKGASQLILLFTKYLSMQ